MGKRERIMLLAPCGPLGQALSLLYNCPLYKRSTSVSPAWQVGGYNGDNMNTLVNDEVLCQVKN